MPKPSVITSGPTQWWVNVGPQKAWRYLGMCEADTTLDLSPVWEGISIDGSARVDFDRQFMGVSAGISGDLARWDESVLDQLKLFINDDANNNPGTWGSGALGSMVRTEDKVTSLVIQSLYATKTAYATAGAHAFWYFPMVFALPMRRNLSAKATRERIAFEAIPITDGTGAMTLYAHSFNFDLPDPT